MVLRVVGPVPKGRRSGSVEVNSPVLEGDCLASLSSEGDSLALLLSLLLLSFLKLFFIHLPLTPMKEWLDWVEPTRVGYLNEVQDVL